MAKVLVKKTLSGWLVPSDDKAREVFKKIAQGVECWADIRKARNPKHHRLFFALLHLVYDNQDRYLKFEHFRAMVQIAAGHCEWIPGLDGVAVPIPKSVDYSSLDEIEFSKVFNEAMTVCVDEFLQGVELDHLRAEIERYAA